MRIWLVMVVAAIPTAGWSQVRQGEVGTEEQPTVIEAHVIEASPPTVRAEGDVVFEQGEGQFRRRLRADQAIYNTQTAAGRMTSASFTTCDLPRPHYRIAAQEIRLSPDQRLKLRRVRIYLGRRCLISLPSLSINVGPGALGEILLPRPGYSSRDGFFLTTRFALVDTDKTGVNLQLRPTTRRGVQGGVIGAYAIMGSARLASAYVADSDMELRRESPLPSLVEREVWTFPEPKPEPPLLSAFAALLVRERAFDIDVPNLLATRLPEIGVRYISPQARVVRENGQPRVGLQVQGQTSWGRFTETPGGGYVSRWDTRGVVSTTLAAFGRSTALRGSVLARYSTYGGGNSYRVLGAALEVSRVFSGGSFASMRLIAHDISGSTPLEFDDIDIRRELQAAGRCVLGRSTFAVLLDYDLDKQSLRDWQVSIGRRLHCLEPTIIWRHRFRQISFDLRVLGL